MVVRHSVCPQSITSEQGTRRKARSQHPQLLLQEGRADVATALAYGKVLRPPTETWLWPNMSTVSWDGAGPGNRSSSPTWQRNPGHPSLTGPAPIRGTEQAPSRASQGLLHGMGQCPFPTPRLRGVDAHTSTCPPWGVCKFCSHHISSSGPSLYLAPFCLAISIPACTEREREREAISAPTACSKAYDIPALGRSPRRRSCLQEMGTGQGPQG